MNEVLQVALTLAARQIVVERGEAVTVELVQAIAEGLLRQAAECVAKTRRGRAHS